MKKLYIFVTLLFSVIFSANVLQAKTFTRSTETVSFAGADYTLLKSPFATSQVVSGYLAHLDFNDLDFAKFTDFISVNPVLYTPVNALGQYKYGNIAYSFGTAIDEWYSDDYILVNEYFSLFNRDREISPTYNLVIDYTFTSPSDIIVNVDDMGWFQAGTNVSRVSLTIYVTWFDYNETLHYSVDFYLNYYDNNNVLINSSGAFGGTNTYIGIAFHGISQVDYDNGYQSGYNNGLSNGSTQGYDNGYKDGKKDYGYNDNGTIVSGDIAWNKGYDRGANDNMPNFFVLITDSVFSAVTRIGNIEILPNLKISYIAGIILALGLVKFITGRKGDD